MRISLNLELVKDQEFGGRFLQGDCFALSVPGLDQTCQVHILYSYIIMHHLGLIICGPGIK